MCVERCSRVKTKVSKEDLLDSPYQEALASMTGTQRGSLSSLVPFHFEKGTLRPSVIEAHRKSEESSVNQFIDYQCKRPVTFAAILP